MSWPTQGDGAIASYIHIDRETPVINDHPQVGCGRAAEPGLVLYQKLLDEDVLPRLERPDRYVGPYNAPGTQLASAKSIATVLLWPSVPESHRVPSSLAPVLTAVESRLGVAVELLCLPAPDLDLALARRGLPLFSRPNWLPFPSFSHILAWIDQPSQLMGLVRLIELAGLSPRNGPESETRLLVVAGPAVAYLGRTLEYFADRIWAESDPGIVAQRFAELCQQTPTTSGTAAEVLSQLLEGTAGPASAAAGEIGPDSANATADSDSTPNSTPISTPSTRRSPRKASKDRRGGDRAGLEEKGCMVLPAFLQRPLVKVDERFGGVRVTRLSLWAASSALRDRLGLASESELVEACREALANDSAQLELGLCLGLPGEEPADRAAIGELVRQLVKLAPRGHRQIRVDLGAFAGSEGPSADDLAAMVAVTAESISEQKVKVKSPPPFEIWLSQMLGSGDEDIIPVIENLGANTSGDGSLAPQRWQEALRDTQCSHPDFPLATGAHSRSPSEDAADAAATGLEGQEPIPSRLDEDGHLMEEVAGERDEAARPAKDNWSRWRALAPGEFLLRLDFSRQGRMRYLAHREVGDLIVAACRRARVPLASAGVVSPRPKIGFGPSLPVGVEGLHEFADLSLTRKIGGIKSLLNEHLPDGLRVNESRYMPSSTAKATKARLERAVYEARIVLESGADDGSWFDGLTRRVDALKSASTWDLEPATGSTDSGDDVKNQVSDMELSVHADGSLILGFALDLTGNGARLRPGELIELVLDGQRDHVRHFFICRTRLLARGSDPMAPLRTPMEMVAHARRRTRELAKRHA